MSDYPVASRKSDFQSVPRAFQANGPECQVAVLAVSATAITLDLTKGFSQAAYTGTQGPTGPTSPVTNFLTIVSDVDIGIVFGPTNASVSSANAPVIATNGTLTGATYTGAAGTCFVIKANSQPTRFLPQAGLDNFLAIVGSGAGKVRIYQSSCSNA